MQQDDDCFELAPKLISGCCRIAFKVDPTPPARSLQRGSSAGDNFVGRISCFKLMPPPPPTVFAQFWPSCSVYCPSGCVRRIAVCAQCVVILQAQGSVCDMC